MVKIAQGFNFIEMLAYHRVRATEIYQVIPRSFITALRAALGAKSRQTAVAKLDNQPFKKENSTYASQRLGIPHESH